MEEIAYGARYVFICIHKCIMGNCAIHDGRSPDPWPGSFIGGCQIGLLWGTYYKLYNTP